MPTVAPVYNQTTLLFTPETSKGYKYYSENLKLISSNDFPEPDEQTLAIDNVIAENGKNAYCLTFIGYSALGYAQPELLKKGLLTVLERSLEEHVDKKIVVVCGGTRVGIGIVYDLIQETEALKEKVSCLGIVSELAKGDIQNDDVNQVFIPDPHQCWKTVTTVNGEPYSYMLYPAHRYGGEVLAFGGGEIGAEEVRQAKKMGLKTTIFFLEPDRANLLSKLNAGIQWQKLCAVLYNEGYRMG